MTSLPQLPSLWNVTGGADVAGAKSILSGAWKLGQSNPIEKAATGFIGGQLLRVVFIVLGLVMIIVGFTQFHGPAVVIENAKAAAKTAVAA